MPSSHRHEHCLCCRAACRVSFTVTEAELPPLSVVSTIDISRHPVIRLHLPYTTVDLRVIDAVPTVMVLCCAKGKDGNEAYFMQSTLTTRFLITPVESFVKILN
jgi:hypothetical protein